jgi:hypothetical protein
MFEIEEDPRSLADATLSARIVELTELADRVEAARLAAVTEWDRRAVWAFDGAPSGASWLTARTGTGRAVAGGTLRTARQLGRLPAVAEALGSARITPAKARLLAGVVNPRTAEAFARDETMLIDQAEVLSVDDLASVLRFWTVRADPDGPGPTDPDDNTAHLSQTLGGRWRFDANLDIEGGGIFATVWDHITEELRRDRRDHPSTPSRLRADALVELARRASGARAPGRPLVWIIRRPDGTSELAGSGPLSASGAARYNCDADIAEVTMDGNGDVLNVGRTRRTATDTQRRALALRDGGCTVSGCARPPNWCEAHHIVWWEHGGPTDMCNLCLLCSFHHHEAHRGRLQFSCDADGRHVVIHIAQTHVTAA